MIVNVLPALNGDCILVEYTTLHYILIDGGYVDTYKEYLLPRLNEIAKHGGVLDLLVVTHIDSDHISGIIKLLEEDELPILIKSIWYNGYRHVQSDALITDEPESFVHRSISKEAKGLETRPISAKQGCTLSALIARRGIAWNEPANGKTIQTPLTFPLNNVVIHVLSPSQRDIENLEVFWKKRLIKDGLLSKAHSEEYWDDAFEFSLSQEKPGFRFHNKKVSKCFDLTKIKDEPYEPDSSATNGSSISFVLESERKTILFLGDAHAETIVESLKTLYGEDCQPYHFDAVKLSHHGSYNNNSPELLSIIHTDKWLVSTNGDKYNHPDIATLAHIITKGEGNRVYFNYCRPVCRELMLPVYHEKYDFDIVLPGEEGFVITL